MKIKCAALLLVTIASLGGVAAAHHSAAAFDRTKTVVLHGTVKAYRFANPHSWIYLLMPVNGKEQEWQLEGGSISILVRNGFTSSTVKPGDEISVSIHPRTDGAPGGAFQSVTTAGGKTLAMNPLY